MILLAIIFALSYNSSIFHTIKKHLHKSSIPLIMLANSADIHIPTILSSILLPPQIQYLFSVCRPKDYVSVNAPKKGRKFWVANLLLHLAANKTIILLKYTIHILIKKVWDKFVYLLIQFSNNNYYQNQAYLTDMIYFRLWMSFSCQCGSHSS